MLLNWPNSFLMANSIHQSINSHFVPKMMLINASSQLHFIITPNSSFSSRKRKMYHYEEEKIAEEIQQKMIRNEVDKSAKEKGIEKCNLLETNVNLSKIEGTLQQHPKIKSEISKQQHPLFSSSSSKFDTTNSISTTSSTLNSNSIFAPSSIDAKNGKNECAICDVPASGVHYLVHACTGCKTFFRRSIMENRKYSCKRQGKCKIDVKTRCICRHCRFVKCQKMGMKLTEIKVDRKRPIVHENLLSEMNEFDEMNKTLKMKELTEKEYKFRILLNCCEFGPKYANLNEAMKKGNNIFEDDKIDWEQRKVDKINKNEAKNRLTFYHWRVKTLSIIIDWARSFSSFKQLTRSDQEKLIVHSAFALLAFSEAHNTPQHYGDRLAFPDGLQVTRNFSNGIYFERNGLHRAMVAVINEILTPIRRIQMTQMEYVHLQALLLFDPDCLALSDEALEIVKREREIVLQSLRQHLEHKYKGKKCECANRMGQILIRIQQIQKVAELKRHFFIANAEIHMSTFCIEQSSLAIDLANKYSNTSFF